MLRHLCSRVGGASPWLSVGGSSHVRSYITSDERLVEVLARRLIEGERRALSKAVTLIESTLPRDRRAADQLLAHAQEWGKLKQSSIRVGFSGPPGVGKSTFIEAIGNEVVQRGYNLAVLAVDPSSARTGGSILGDKTRMPTLSVNPHVFIRPSPSSGTLGGVTRATSGAILLAEAAGYDVVFVETVGVGQSETAVEDLVDIFVLLVPPAGGDELQGVKRGIMEMADVIAVTKGDGELKNEARRTRAEYSSAISLTRPKYPGIWSCEVITTSAVTKRNIDVVWDKVEEFMTLMRRNGVLQERRGKQQVSWMWKMIHDDLLVRFHEDPEVKSLLDTLEPQVRALNKSPSVACNHLLDAFLSAHCKSNS